MRIARSLTLLTLIACCLIPHAVATQPKLVLWLTVDQLRGDQPLRLADRFGEGGFRYLMARGVHYTNAHYQHSTTFTAVGHATLFTGASPSEHGLAGNDWYSFTKKNYVYCVEDDRHHILEKQPVAHAGTSPRNLDAPTLGDELVTATDGRSRVFSVSIKDRGAILPGGRLGKAFWYDSGAGAFVTSSYYYKDYPAWAKRWNNQRHADRYAGKAWTLLHDESTYRRPDDRPYELGAGGLGRTFPHALKFGKEPGLYSAIRYTPFGDELTLDFARQIVISEKLGAGEAPDLLAVSLSCTDYIGHAFGPSSRETEDNLLRLDRSLANFLSSDHGIDEAPEHTAAMLKRNTGAEPGCCATGRRDGDAMTAAANKMLRQRYGIQRDLISEFYTPSFYLDLQAVAASKLSVTDVERTLAAYVRTIPGVAVALTRTDLTLGLVPPNAITTKMQKAFHATRTGSVMIAQQPSWYLNKNAGGSTAMHGSPHRYDTYVPIMFAGPGIEPMRVARLVAPKDIAPTVATYLGLKAPAASSGKVLEEVVGR
ncbi:MAG: alkaline phosphatase family protein [Planctomycetota bacterium]|jgi:arylsulfatase A-like enzyme